MTEESESDWGGYESGPFCRHWGDPSDCEEKCAVCGHSCHEHGSVDDEPCTVEGCTCPGWKESD